MYLIGRDYSFGQAVLREAKKQLAAAPRRGGGGRRAAPVGRVKDFAPYAVKIKSSGAQAVVTGNWGNDLTLLVKAAREVGYEGSFYTFYGNALGAPAAMGDAGIGKVVAVADWLPNVPGAQSEAFYQSFRERFPKPQDDYVHMRMQLMIEALAQSMERAGTTDVVAVARQMEKASVQLAGQGGTMRAADHQFQQALAVGVMDKKGAPGVKFDVEGSGYGFRVVRQIPAARRSSRTAATCSGLDRRWIRRRRAPAPTAVSAAGGQGRVACGGHFAPQLNHRHGVVAGPVVARDGVEVFGARHVGGRIATVFQFHQGQRASVLGARRIQQSALWPACWWR